ncbi:DUF2798 domain-containing protein [Ciceribacter sp. L1K22]|uniref:DUF2798 domain-containing protein n=1 Tax=Ciceribacter sp. L1K22 TaxID=2820275 RepID=UPI001ABEC781|nr:DUF2798 domain-containing protein [Ciceribacter sp. L1K22]MBO3761071.1 DUF2798 domain-containing protein [Ciceribacter sp. L1K22]
MAPQIKVALLTSLMMSFAMSLFFSGFFTYRAFGFGADWLWAWGRGIAIGWPIGFLIATAIGGPVRMIALRLAGVSGRV